MNSENQKFRKFYVYGGILWLVFVGAFYLGNTWVNDNPSNLNIDFINGILSIILTFGVFGIPGYYGSNYANYFGEAVPVISVQTVPVLYRKKL